VDGFKEGIGLGGKIGKHYEKAKYRVGIAELVGRCLIK
jgi:hypothetical protein